MGGSADSATILVAFGATGDLMARKVVPSLLHLYRHGHLPVRFRVIGYSRRDWSDERFRDHVRGIVADKYPDVDADDPFFDLFVFQGGTFEDEAAYRSLADKARAITDEWGVCANKLFYLAVPPENYATILHNLAGNRLTEACSEADGYTRVLIEKPFGSDVASSKALDDLLASLLREEQIYRIDHYLAKEMLQAILAFRFNNDLLESEWDNSRVERIDISLLETLGVESRGAFYDGVGALRDVGQNHLLQMLALVTMEQPAEFEADAIREARAELLAGLRPLRPDQVAARTYRAQYDGYRAIPGVAAGSQTETYFRMDTVLSGPRWEGVPVMFEAGKRIGSTPLKRIVVTLRHRTPCLCGADGSHLHNRVVFTLEPDDTIRTTFWAKRPGFEYEVEERAFEFALYEKSVKLQYVEEYAKLVHDAIAGDQTAFVSTDEVRAMWAFTDPVIDAWRDGAVPLESYAPDTGEAPARAQEVLAGGPKPQVGAVGLGRMGAGIALNLLDHGFDVVGYNRTYETALAMAEYGLKPAATLADLVAALRPPRVVWLMVPAGAAVDTMLFGDGEAQGLAELLQPGDTVIDGGNTRFTDDAARAGRLQERGIGFLDCGTSGGPTGARRGACLMIGGDEEVFRRVEPVFAAIAVRGGYRRFGDVGSGHFVKMVHNGIEYGMMQSIAEGFALMHASPYGLDLEAVAAIYQHQSVVESRLVGWLADAYARFGDELEAVSGVVGHTGEGAWTVEAARDAGIETPAIEAAMDFRLESAARPGYTGQVVQALRNEFGGHGLGERPDGGT